MSRIKNFKFRKGFSWITTATSYHHYSEESYRVHRIFAYITLVSLFSISLGSALVTLDEIFGLAIVGGNHYTWPNPNLLDLGTSHFLVPVSLWSSWEIVFMWIIVSTIGLAISFGLVFYNLRRGLEARAK